MKLTYIDGDGVGLNCEMQIEDIIPDKKIPGDVTVLVGNNDENGAGVIKLSAQELAMLACGEVEKVKQSFDDPVPPKKRSSRH